MVGTDVDEDVRKSHLDALRPPRQLHHGLATEEREVEVMLLARVVELRVEPRVVDGLREGGGREGGRRGGGGREGGREEGGRGEGGREGGGGEGGGREGGRRGMEEEVGTWTGTAVTFIAGLHIYEN